MYHSLGDKQVVQKKSQNVQKAIDIKYETTMDSKLFACFFFSNITFNFFKHYQQMIDQKLQINI